MKPRISLQELGLLLSILSILLGALSVALMMYEKEKASEIVGYLTIVILIVGVSIVLWTNRDSETKPFKRRDEE